ncbi:MAG: pilus assembly protein [Chloroflexi bacterium]|nr:pilus assembly protein [Chloroflexota bacterium]
MKNLIKLALSFQTTEKKQQHSRAQSLVEFAITLPILILLLTGMVEFGFMLNTYLSIQDAARSTARRYSTINPFDATGADDPAFYSGAAEYAIDLLAPAGDPDSRQIELDPTRDNILISLIGVEVDESTDPDSISSIIRYSGAQYYKHFGDTNPPTGYPDSAITAMMTANGAEPSDAGLLIVEIYYGYEGTLNLPWTTPFFSPGNPSMLYVSVAMPIIYAKPFDQTAP